MIKMKDLKDLTLTELMAKSRDLRQELFNLQLQKATSQLEKPSRMRELRRDIARIETQISMILKRERQQKAQEQKVKS